MALCVRISTAIQQQQSLTSPCNRLGEYRINLLLNTMPLLRFLSRTYHTYRLESFEFCSLSQPTSL